MYLLCSKCEFIVSVLFYNVLSTSDSTLEDEREHVLGSFDILELLSMQIICLLIFSVAYATYH